jgi:hypothetical protein
MQSFDHRWMQMSQTNELIDIFSDSRMKYGHLIIILLYGSLAVFLLGPFVVVFFMPLEQATDLSTITVTYWQESSGNEVLGFLFYLSVAFNAGILLSSVLQVPPFILKKKWRGIREAAGKTINSDNAEYSRFLFWLEERPHMSRVRSWNWFISNAYATFASLILLYFLANLLFLILLNLWPSLGTFISVRVTHRSWVPVVTALAIFVFLLPGTFHHYRARAAEDDFLLQEFRRTTATNHGAEESSTPADEHTATALHRRL